MLIVEIFLGVLLLAAFILFSVNFRHEIQSDALSGLYHDEQIVDTLHTSSVYDKQNTYLTNRRLYQIQKKWFLSRTLFTYFDLKEISGIHYVELQNVIALAIGIALSFIVLPLGYLIILFSLVHYIVRLTFYSNNRKIRIHSSMADKDSFRAFLQRVQIHSFREKTGIESKPPVIPQSASTAGKDLRLGMNTIAVIAIYFALGLLQKMAQGSVKFDDSHFFPIYLAIPLVSGHWFGPAVGFKSGFFGGLALLTLIFPIPFYAIGKTLFLTEYAAVLVYLSLSGLITGLLKKKWVGLSVLAGWLLIVALFHSGELYNIHLYLKLLLAALLFLIADMIYKKKTE